MIRKTLDTDIPAVMTIYDAARAFMRAHGNATQWPEGTPSAEQLAADIAAGGSYVCEVDGRVVATFAFLPGPDECYDVIEDGQWRSDTPYAVLHRVASDGTCTVSRLRCLPLPRNVSTICVSTRTKITCLCRAPSPRPGLSAPVSYMCRTVRRASRLIGCARHKNGDAYQQFARTKMAPGGAIFVRCADLQAGIRKARTYENRRAATRGDELGRGIGPASPAGP